MPLPINNQSGAITLGATIVVFLAAMTIASSIALIGIGELIGGYEQVKSERAFGAADSCLDEAMLRLARDSSYTGGTLSVGNDSCTISVSGSGGSRTISVEATSGSSTRDLSVDVSISGSSVTIDTWGET